MVMKKKKKKIGKKGPLLATCFADQITMVVVE